MNRLSATVYLFENNQAAAVMTSLGGFLNYLGLAELIISANHLYARF